MSWKARLPTGTVLKALGAIVAAGTGLLAWLTIGDRLNLKNILTFGGDDYSISDAITEEHRRFDEAIEIVKANPAATLAVENSLSRLRQVTPHSVADTIIITDDLAIGAERLSYVGSERRKVYWVDGERVCRVTSRGTSDISAIPPDLKRGAIFCTEVANQMSWLSAREQYAANHKYMLDSGRVDYDTAGHSKALERLAAALRNSAYFNICDSLLSSRDGWGAAATALQAVYRITGLYPEQLRTRHQDAEAKLEFVMRMQSGAQVQDCASLCVTSPSQCRVDPTLVESAVLPLPEAVRFRVEAMTKEVRSGFDGRPQQESVHLRNLTTAEQQEIDETLPYGSPVTSTELVALDVRFRDATGILKYGRIIAPRFCNVAVLRNNAPVTALEYRGALAGRSQRKAVAEELMAFFEDNFRREDFLPIEWLIPYHFFLSPAHELGVTPDELSMRCNNSYAFAAREIRDTGVWSRHTFGALDLNPYYNPAITLTPDARRKGIGIAGVGPEAVGLGLILVEPATAMYSAFSREARHTPYTLDASSPAVSFFSSRDWTWGGTFTTLRDYQHFGIAE